MRTRAAGALLLALTAVGAPGFRTLAAQDRATQLVARPVLMFNQSLYHGTFEQPRAIAYDPRHRELWVAEGNGRIAIHRPDGVELFSFSAKAHVSSPGRIAIRPQGGIAVIESGRGVVRLFDYRGSYAGDVPLGAIGPKPVIGAIAYDRDGQLYVADNASFQIFVFRPDGSLKFQFGSRGEDEGQFQGVCAIRVGPDGTIYVLDQRALAVQMFDSQGNFLRGWGKHEMGAQNVSLPSGLAIDSRGRVYLTDELRQQVKVYAPDGSFLLAFGGLGAGLGQLTFPTDIAIDENDRVYVSERRTARVQVFELHEVPAAE